MQRKAIAGSLLLIALAFMVTANAGGFGEYASNCGDIRGCMNFTMSPGQIRQEGWGLQNAYDYPVSFYIAAPYYGNSSYVPEVVYGVPCMQGNTTSNITYNTTVGQYITTQVQQLCLRYRQIPITRYQL